MKHIKQQLDEIDSLVHRAYTTIEKGKNIVSLIILLEQLAVVTYNLIKILLTRKP